MARTFDRIVQTANDFERRMLIKSAVKGLRESLNCPGSTSGPTMILVHSLDEIQDLSDLPEIAGSIIGCGPDEMRLIPTKPSCIIIGLALQLAERLSKKQFKRSWFKFIIISELNEILARGCRDQVQELLRDTSEDTQILITSSSAGNDVLSFKKFLKSPQISLLPVRELSLTGVQNYFINYKHMGWKLQKLLELIKTNGDEPTVIICNSRRTVENLAEDLQKVVVEANTLHADLSQRDRNDVVTMFLSGITQYLIATELAYNSVSKDIQNSLIINYDMPQTREKYLNRVGEPVGSHQRKTVVNFIIDDDARLLRDIERYSGVAMEEMIGHVAV